MFWHFFALATLGKPAVALAIIASAYGAGSALVSSDYRTPNPSAHETARPQTSPKPTPAAVPTPPAPPSAALLTKSSAPTNRGRRKPKGVGEKATAATDPPTD